MPCVYPLYIPCTYNICPLYIPFTCNGWSCTVVYSAVDLVHFKGKLSSHSPKSCPLRPRPKPKAVPNQNPSPIDTIGVTDN